MSDDIEDRAKGMGWAPKEEWRGPPEKWIDAQAFVDRGEEILPILRATNRKLQDEVSELRNKLSASDQAIKNSMEAIAELKEFNSESNKERMRASKEALVAKLKEAKKEGDVDAEVAIGDQLDKVRAAEREEPKSTPKVNGTTEPDEGPQDYTKNPDWQAWVADNPWFGKETRKTSVALAIAAELRQDPANKGLTGRKFFDKVADEVDRTLGGAPRRSPPKVEGSAQSGGDGGPKKSFADLPADIRQTCDRQAQRLVGPKEKGFAYQKIEDWRAAYVSRYFEGE